MDSLGRIRRAVFEDRKNILDLGKLVFSPNDQVGLRLQIDDFFRNYDLNFLDECTASSGIRQGLLVGQEWYVFERPEQDIGGFSGIEIHFYEGDARLSAWLNWTAVHPSFQSNGVGKRLLEYCEQRAHDLGIGGFGIKTTPEYESAIRMYRKAGYALSGCLRDYYGGGKDLLIFYKHTGETVPCSLPSPILGRTHLRDCPSPLRI